MFAEKLVVFIASLSLLLLLLLLPPQGAATVVLKLGCLGSNFTTGNFPHVINAAVRYMTEFSPSSAFPTAQEILRNETALSFFSPDQVIFNVTCFETTNANGSIFYSRILLEQFGVQAIIGESNSAISEVTSDIAKQFKKPMISYAASSNSLSNKDRFPFFMRTVPADNAQSRFVVDFLFYYRFLKIATVYSADTYGRSGAQGILSNAQQQGITVLDQLEITDDTIATALTRIQASGATTVVGFISLISTTEKLLLAAAARGMLQAPYIWIFSESFGNVLNFKEASVTPVSAALEGLTNNLMIIRLMDSAWTQNVFFQEAMRTNPRRSPFDQFAFDAGLLFGKAVSAMLKRGEDVDDGELLLSRMLKTSFVGASGRIRFDENGDRLGGMYSMENLVDRQLHRLATYSVESGINVISNVLKASGGRKVTAAADQDTSYTIAGNRWKSRLNVPSVRFGHALVAHEPSARMFMFGGYNLETVLGDVWTYSFRTELWQPVYPLTSAAPDARYDASYALHDNYMYLYGGFDLKRYRNDFWKLNIDTYEWIQLTTVDESVYPGPRTSANMIAYNGNVYLMGGVTIDGCNNDLWRYSITAKSWSKVTYQSANNPVARNSACWSLYENKVVLFGGESCSDANVLNDMWMFDFQTTRWTELIQTDAPAPRYDLACNTIGGSFYVGFGFSVSSSLNDIHQAVIDIDNGSAKWTTVFTDVPQHRGRDSTPFAVYQNNLIWFGGWPSLVHPTNDMHAYDIVTKKLTEVNGQIVAIEGRANGCYAVTGTIIYSFGGRTQDKSDTNDLYAYSVDTQQWELVSLQSDVIPPARVGCSLVSSGATLYLFGGRSVEDNEYFGDLWMFSTSQKNWTRIDKPVLSPSVRAFHSAVLTKNESMMIVYGGRDAKQQFESDIWVLDIDVLRWFVLPTNKTLAPKGVIECKVVLIEDERTLIVYGGTNLADIPMSEIMAFSFHDYSWSIYSKRPDNVSVRGRGGIVPIMDNGLILYGGAFFFSLLPEMFYVTRDGWREINQNSAFENPAPRCLHALELIGNRIYTMHGTGSFASTNTQSSVVLMRDVWEFPLSPVCSDTVAVDTRLYSSNSSIGSCVNCSRGTYESLGKCLSCPEGTYNSEVGAKRCVSCPPGFFNPLEGATSYKYCLPCDEGTYNPSFAQPSCIPCPVSSYCPIGSAEPVSKTFNNVDSLIFGQPEMLLSNARMVLIVNLSSFGIAAVISAVFGSILLIVTAKVTAANQLVSKIDKLYTTRHMYGIGVLTIKRTRFGGLFTMIAWLFIAAMIVTVVYRAVTDGVEERRSLVPNLVTSRREILGDMSISLEVSGALYSCQDKTLMVDKTHMKAVNKSEIAYRTNCADTITLAVSSLIYKPDDLQMTCQNGDQNTFDDYFNSCSVQITCKTCGMSADDARVLVSAIDRSFASNYVYKVNASTGINKPPIQYSWLQANVRPTQGRLFRGLSTATKAKIKLVQTRFSFPRSNVNNTGFHVDYEGTELGEQVSIYEFSQKIGFQFSFELKKEGTSLDITYAQKKEVIDIILEILSSSVGVISACAIVMRVLEFILDVYIPKAINQMRRQLTVKKQKSEQEMQETTSPTTGGDTPTCQDDNNKEQTINRRFSIMTTGMIAAVAEAV